MQDEHGPVPPPLPRPSRPPRRARPGFPPALWVFVAIAFLLGLVREGGASSAYGFGRVLGHVVFAFLPMLLTYYLSKRTWVAALVGSLLLLWSLAASGYRGAALNSMMSETQRRMAVAALSMDDFNAAGGIEYSRLSTPSVLDERLKLAKKVRTEFEKVAAWLAGDDELQKMFKKERLSKREVELLLDEIDEMPEFARLRRLTRAQCELFGALVSLLELLEREAGKWEADSEGTIVFTSETADASSSQANELLAKMEAADQRRRQVLEELTKK